EINADVELGGSEQLFNLMVGRRLQEMAGQEPQVCLTLPILRGLDGVRRMGKSLGNYIGVGETPTEQFGKTLSIPDALIGEWFERLTDRTADEVERLLVDPRAAKEELGKDVVAFYHGREAAAAAAEEFRSRFREKKDPTEIQPATVPAASLKEGA